MSLLDGLPQAAHATCFAAEYYYDAGQAGWRENWSLRKQVGLSARMGCHRCPPCSIQRLNSHKPCAQPQSIMTMQHLLTCITITVPYSIVCLWGLADTGCCILSQSSRCVCTCDVFCPCHTRATAHCCWCFELCTLGMQVEPWKCRQRLGPAHVRWLHQ